MTPTGLKWYWVDAILRRRACTSLWTLDSGSSTQRTQSVGEVTERSFSFPSYIIKRIFSSTPNISVQFFCCFELLSSSSLIHFPVLDSKFFSHTLPFSISLSLEALAPLAGPLPLGVLAELCLWFTHSVPSGLTGWHKDMEQSWERRAGSMELQTNRAIYYWKKVSTEWGSSMSSVIWGADDGLGLWFLWTRQKMGDWSGRC